MPRDFRPTFYLRFRRWLAMHDNHLLVDQRKVAEHNVSIARKELQRAQATHDYYLRELAKVDGNRRINDSIIASDTLTLAARAR